MKTRIEIRRAIRTDLDGIARIEQESFGADAFSRRQLIYLIVRAKGACFIAVSDDRLQGYISLLERPRIGNLRIYSVAVAPGARGLGIGQVLVNRAVEYARTCRAREITLEVNVANTAAQTLYLKNGFVMHSRLPGYYHDGADGWHMKRTMEVY